MKTAASCTDKLLLLLCALVFLAMLVALRTVRARTIVQAMPPRTFLFRNDAIQVTVDGEEATLVIPPHRSVKNATSSNLSQRVKALAPFPR